MKPFFGQLLSRHTCLTVWHGIEIATKNRAKLVRKHVQIYKIFPVDDQLSVFDSAGSILQKMRGKNIISAEMYTS